MAKTTHVKSAQQRYATKPVLDVDGNPIRTPLTNKDGSPKTTKHGRAITIARTVRDTDRPLPPETCGSCGKPIEVGTPYKHVTVKRTYGGTRYTRHEDCPNWQPWELSDALWARIAQVQASYEPPEDPGSIEDIQDALSSVAEQARELAEEKAEAADSLESGFGHETEQSSEIRSNAEGLEEWADNIENVDLPEFPEPEEEDCETCDGTGNLVVPNPKDEDDDSATKPCEDCDGTGQVTPEDPTEEQIEEWREEALAAAEEAVNDCPVG